MSFTHQSGIEITIEVAWDNTNWDDISDDLRFMEMRSAQRSRTAGVYDPGSLVLTLDNRARTYDPLHAAGPYFGDLKPGRHIRVTFDSAATAAKGVWYGQVDAFAIDYDQSNNDSTATITAIDALGMSALVAVFPGIVPALTENETVLSRLDAIEAQVGGPTFADGGYTAGYSAQCSGISRWSSASSQRMIDLIRVATNLEQGPAIASGSGITIRVHPRYWFKLRPRSATSQATVGTAGLAFYDIAIKFDALDIVTTCSATSESGETWVNTDPAGEAEYGIRAPQMALDRLPAARLGDLIGVANTVVGLRATEEFRIDELTVKPQADAGWLSEVIELEPLDRITVAFTPTRTGSPITSDHFIEGITHVVTPAEWVTTYRLGPCKRYDDGLPGSLFIIGTSLLGGTDVLGF